MSMARLLPKYQFCVMFSVLTTSARLLGYTWAAQQPGRPSRKSVYMSQLPAAHAQPAPLLGMRAGATLGAFTSRLRAWEFTLDSQGPLK
jgi:hypothetical protein